MSYNPGDIVLCWRPSFILSPFFKAKILFKVGRAYRISRFGGLLKEWYPSNHIEGIVMEVNNAAQPTSPN